LRQWPAPKACSTSWTRPTAYPLDFVIFRITGITPKTVASDLLTGMLCSMTLACDRAASDTLDLQTRRSPEPVLSIDDVTKSSRPSKTIQRWRRADWPARRFLFPDGKRRVGSL